VPDFPKKGIMFKDITPLLSDAKAFQLCSEILKQRVRHLGITKIAGIESRGFIFGCALAQAMNLGFVPIRKKGKLPAETFSENYTLEYGVDTLQIHQDALTYTDRVLIIDDLLATGGTAAAAVKLVRQTGANIAAMSFIIELDFLSGREKLKNQTIISLLNYT
jgi:adenine phosphoribosyltransferase